MSGLVGDRGELGAIDFRGLYLILACIGTLIMYGSLCIGTRFFRSRNRMGVVAAGRIRIAAARGDIDTLDNLSKITKYFQCDATLGGFTALHAAACSKQPGKSSLWTAQIQNQHIFLSIQSKYIVILWVLDILILLHFNENITQGLYSLYCVNLRSHSLAVSAWGQCFSRERR